MFEAKRKTQWLKTKMASKRTVAVLTMLENEVFAEENNILLKILNLFKSSNQRDTCQLTAALLIPDQTTQEKHIRPKGYYENIIPSYSLSEFQSHFRLERTTFESLLCVIHQHSSTLEVRPGNTPMPIEKQTLITLWYLANEETMRSIADRFDTAKSSIHNAVKNITRILTDLKSHYISWPYEEYRETASSFQTRGNFPGVMGAIDGTHISIEAPEEHQKDYLNRKMSHSVILQAICNSRGLFTDCFAGIPGSRHDAHVFRQSGIYNAIQENKRKYFPTDQFHLVGDSAYPVMSWLLVPFKDFGDLTEEQQRYNYKLSQTRIIIEMTFGRLKGSFRRLHHVNTKLENIPNIIMSACVLHNFRMMHEDEYTIEVEDTDMDLSATLTALSCNKASAAGIKKRAEICKQL